MCKLKISIQVLRVQKIKGKCQTYKSILKNQRITIAAELTSHQTYDTGAGFSQAIGKLNLISTSDIFKFTVYVGVEVNYNYFISLLKLRLNICGT